MEKRSWKFRRYSWKYWRVCFGITAERDRRTRGWRFGIRCIPLFCLMWTYRVPSWNGWYELETSFVVSLLPGLPVPGGTIPVTYKKDWARTRITEFRSLEEAVQHHGN